MTKEELEALIKETVAVNNRLGSGAGLDFDWWRKFNDVTVPRLLKRMEAACIATSRDTYAQGELRDHADDLKSRVQRYVQPAIASGRYPGDRLRERIREAMFATLGPLARLGNDQAFGEVTATQITFEFDIGGPTGFEREDNDELSLDNPYDPNKIRVDPKTFSLRQILDMIGDKDLDLAPDFQRSRVWKAKQKSLLIESLLLRIPLPAFYFLAERDGTLRVVDGLQRLSAVNEFVRGGLDGRGGFALTDLEYLSHMVRDRIFAELDPMWQRRILQTQIFVNVIDPQTPERVKFDIFKRINTGGVPLNTQEMRHCMSGPRSRVYLRACTASKFDHTADSPLDGETETAARRAANALALATESSLIDHLRMGDREVVLRFCAFRLIYPTLDEYAPGTAFDTFLSSATRKLDDEVPDETLKELAESLEQGLMNAHLVFGRHAFRKWTKNQPSSQHNPINRALFESWAVVLASIPWQRLEPAKDRIVSLAREAMTNDAIYLGSISAGTGEHGKVKTRFHRARAIVEEALR